MSFNPNDIELTWTALKSLVSAKGLALQYVDIGSNEYYIWVTEDGIRYYTTILQTDPAGDDQDDFEDNYKSGANGPVNPLATDKTPYVRVTEKTVGKTMQVKGFEMTCAANTVTNHDMVWGADIEMVGGFADAWTSETDFTDFLGSTAEIKVIDIDNILGYGAGFVLNTFAVTIPMLKLLRTGCSALSTTAFTLLEGLYIRISIDNQSETNTLYIAGSLKYYH